MPLSPQQLDGLDQLLLSIPPELNPVPQVRARFPDLAVSRCDASDMRGEAPFRRAGEYDVYLVDTSSHCWRVIDDPHSAGGVLIAARG